MSVLAFWFDSKKELNYDISFLLRELYACRGLILHAVTYNWEVNVLSYPDERKLRCRGYS